MCKWLIILVLFSGCYNPDYTTKHGIDVFCHCDFPCPDQAYVEHAVDYFIASVEVTHDWDAQGDFRYDLITFYPHALPCGDDLCMGMVYYNRMGAEVRLEYHEDWLISQTALFHELIKKKIALVMTDYVYESEAWLKVSDILREYRAIEKEFLENR